jgi:4-hydroxybenzoate polyprenyltransferase
MIWGLALTLFAIWLLGLLLGRGGFIHIMLLCAVTVAVVQWMHEHRARQR